MKVCMITAENVSFFQHFLDREFASDVISYGLMAEGVACGCAQVTLDQGQGKLCHMFVAPTFRRLGGGTLLLQTIGRELKRHGVERITASAAYLTYGEMAYVGHFLKGCHWVEQPVTSWRYTFPLAQACAQYAKAPVKDKGLIPFGKIIPAQQRSLLKTMSNPEAKRELQEILNLPDLCPHASVLALGQRQLDGYLMVRRWDDKMELVGLRHMGRDSTALYGMIGACFAWAEPVATPDTMVDMLITNEKVKSLAQHMLKDVAYSATPVHHFVHIL
ncbi:GNAT family N-acetyltransferase [Bengtsoniella intestinalis]|uniref:GNAT family N-acetyltransferase n=1 Tax=Bengtsoniella intestinalis TaxID=3073143 RepID=UPI00391F6B2D